MMSKIKPLPYIALVIITSFFYVSAIGQINLNNQNWIHGSNNCEKNTDELIQAVQYDRNTWIFRQNKCINYEAPFMFLFLGEDKALLMDTGATKKKRLFPLYKTVKAIIDDWQKQQNKEIELVVAHTHKHGDHYAADAQFKRKVNTTLVGIKKTDVIDFFKLTNWFNKIVDFKLGNRTLKIIPIPGHQEASIAVYDSSSKLLLSGDTFYPGRLYINDWSSFKTSINRLVEFSKKHEIKYILGNHIEMSSTDGVDYPMGSTNHPEEQKLPLSIEDLQTLQSSLNKLGNKPTRQVHKNFIIYPIK
jgi:hydroxyacylglutathione hydrolase